MGQVIAQSALALERMGPIDMQAENHDTLNKMLYKIEFEIKGLPKMPNQVLRGHWRNAHNNKVLWHGRVMRKVGRNIPEHPIKRARICFTRLSSVEPDYDGLVGSFKPVLDALVKMGILENDKIANVGAPTYLHIKCAPRSGKIKVEIEELP
jgi:Holliday junction resolvase RusA-like endonuclease